MSNTFMKDRNNFLQYEKTFSPTDCHKKLSFQNIFTKNIWLLSDLYNMDVFCTCVTDTTPRPLAVHENYGSDKPQEVRMFHNKKSILVTPV